MQVMDLSFALSGGNESFLKKLQYTYESSGDCLGALAVKVLTDSIYSNGNQNGKLLDKRFQSTDTSETKSRNQSGSKAKSPSGKTQKAGQSQTTSSGKQSKTCQKTGMSMKPCLDLPKRLSKLLDKVKPTLVNRGSNKSLHDVCLICNVFKKRAPLSGLFKSRQFKAIVKSHDTSLSAAVRTQALATAFRENLQTIVEVDQQHNAENMDTSQGHDTPSTSDHVARTPTYAEMSRRKLLAKADRKEKRSAALDDVDLKAQMLDEKIRTARSLLATKVTFSYADKTLTVPSSGTELLVLQRERRKLVQEKRKLIGQCTKSNKKKK